MRGILALPANRGKGRFAARRAGEHHGTARAVRRRDFCTSRGRPAASRPRSAPPACGRPHRHRETRRPSRRTRRSMIPCFPSTPRIFWCRILNKPGTFFNTGRDACNQRGARDHERAAECTAFAHRHVTAPGVRLIVPALDVLCDLLARVPFIRLCMGSFLRKKNSHRGDIRAHRENHPPSPRSAPPCCPLPAGEGEHGYQPLVFFPLAPWESEGSAPKAWEGEGGLFPHAIQSSLPVHGVVSPEFARRSL